MSGNPNKPKQHGADPHAKNCAIYIGKPAKPQTDQEKADEYAAYLRGERPDPRD